MRYCFSDQFVSIYIKILFINSLFDLILYVHSTIFQLCGTGFINRIDLTSEKSLKQKEQF